MATVVREIERKYDAASGGTAALDAVNTMTGTAGVAAVPELPEQLLDAIYYNTADLRLIGAGITLRRRTGGEDAGWHLKLPAGADTRDEIRLPLTSADGAVPEELAAWSGPIPGVRRWRRWCASRPAARRCRPVDGAGTGTRQDRRRPRVGQPADGSAATVWDEIEAELVTGGPALLTAIDEQLRRAGARAAATKTKLQRVLADRLPATGPAPQQRLTRHSPAGEVVLAYLRDQVAAISHYDPLVRRDEPDAVHQMRVATRRARSALEAFGGIIDRETTRPLCAELKWLAAALGQARDSEVLQARLTADLAAVPALVVGPVQARITAHFTAQLTQARQSALDTLDGQRYFRLLDNLDALLADPPLTPLAKREAGKMLAKPVQRAARRLQRALDAVPGAQDRDTAIHQARKATKRARYAAEAAVPALGSAASRQAAQAKELPRRLRRPPQQRRRTGSAARPRRKSPGGGEDTFTYGLMHQRQACQAAEIERALPPVTAAREATEP